MRLLAILFISFLSVSSFAKDTVTILGWWGYLTKEGITSIEKSCDVSLSLDEYYSNAEFLRRWDPKKTSHEIIIYSKTIHEVIKEGLNSSLQLKNPNSYHPSISSKISSLKLNNDTRVFMLSLTGFLWNNKNIQLKDDQSLKEMLYKAQNKIVIVIDDAVEGLELFKSMKILKSPGNDVDLQRIKEINTKILIANEVHDIISNKNFAFAYSWSGSAMKEIESMGESLSFMIHPSLSQVTLDLISIASPNKSSLCVFKYLSGKNFLDRLQNESYYFSPYGHSSSNSRAFSDFHQKYFPYLQKHPWIKSHQVPVFQQIDDAWKKLKLQFNKE